ncbi:MAG: heavy metal translocating P-type ATPase [Phycisphaeraceae bacterium]|nr:heavy metal translocating P-type ATPase [Phycisphaeraceae bacterium]
MRTEAPAEARCDHCSLPVPPGLFDPEADHQFCCAACATAYEVIHSCGLEQYYTLRQRLDDTPSAAMGAAASDHYDRYDDPAFHDLYVEASEDGLLCVELHVVGMHCAACVWLIEAVPGAAPGVVESRVDLGRSMVRLTWEPERIRLSKIARLIDSLGYPTQPTRGAALRALERREDRRLLILLAVAGAVAGNVMLIALALYGGSVRWLGGWMAPEHQLFFRWISAGLGVLAVAWPGGVFLRGALASLRVRRLHLDLPIALALVIGAAWGLANTIRDTGEIYFDSLTTVIFLLLIGRWIQRKQQRRAAGAVELLYRVTPTSVRLVRDGATEQVPIETLIPGAIVEVRAGETVPVDGVVVDGESDIDASTLTGESWPVRAAPGVNATAGGVNLRAPIRVRVEASGEDTRVGRLMRLVEESAQRRAPIVRLADAITGWFVGAVLILATLTAVAWLLIDPSRAVDNAVALLIVTCPCALGLATPLAVLVAIGRASRRGILIKGGDALERLARPGLVLLDKTGTLTLGKAALVRWEGDESIKPLVAALEAQVAHPIAAALVESIGAAGAHTIDHVEHTVGAGVAGHVDGRRLIIGSQAFVTSHVGALTEWTVGAIERCAAEALTPIVIAADGAPAAVAGLGDPIRDDAQPALDKLRAGGWRLGICSGDDPRVVRAVGARLGIDPADCIGAATPEDKLSRVREELHHGPVVMVGDGVNDAAALSAATVGIAVHGGAEVSLESADVACNAPGIAPIAELVAGATRTIHAIRRNLAASLFYNVVCATLAMTGVINPLIAAVLMPVSSVTVITLSFRARTFEPEA